MSATKRAVIYARISQDRSGEGLGVERQIDAALERVSREGWDLVATLRDDSISAWKAGVKRPAYQELLRMVRDGEVDVVLVWHLSRLWRGRVERASGIDTFKDAGVRLAVVQGSDIDFSSAMGRAMVAMLGEMDTMESDIKSERIREQKAQARRMGRTVGGTTPWGYRSVGTKNSRRMEPIPELEPLMLDMFKRYVAGSGVPTLRDELNDRGLMPTISKRGWTTSALQAWMDRAVPFGKVPDGKGGWHQAIDRTPVPGCDDALWEAYLAERDRRRRRRTPRTRVAQWMLSGLVVCGYCGSRMSCNTFNPERSRVACARQRTVGNCPGGGTSVGRIWLERSVGLGLYSEGWSEALLRVTTGADTSDATGLAAGLEARLADLDARIAAGASARVSLVESLMNSSLSSEKYQDLMDDLEASARALDEQRRAVSEELVRVREREGTLAALASGSLDSEALFTSLEAALGETGEDLARWNRILSEVIARIVIMGEDIRVIPTATAELAGASPMEFKRQRKVSPTRSASLKKYNREAAASS